MTFVKNILKKEWNNYKTDFHPKNRRMKVLKDKKIDGMSSENIRYLINEVVKRSVKNGTYLEVGTYRGCSLLSACLFNRSTRCIGIDDFSEFDGTKVIKNGLCIDKKDNKKILKKNLQKFRNPKNIEFYEEDYEKAIKKIFSKEPKLKIDCYFYDGEHSYENQLNGLQIVLPHLKKKCIIFIDDVNFKEVEKATQDFMKMYPEFKSAFKIKTYGNYSDDWWNGFQILIRE